MSIARSTGIKNLLTVLFVLTTGSLFTQRTFKFSPRVFAAYSYYHMEDCACYFEPSAGRQIYKTSGPTIGVHFPINTNLVVQASTNFFQHTYQNNDILIDSYNHEAIYVEFVTRSKNYSLNVLLGYAFGKRRIKIIPELGFAFYSRATYYADYTMRVYKNIDPIPTDHLPEKAPNQIRYGNYTEDDHWLAACVAYGLTGYVGITSRLSLKLAAHAFYTAKWIRDYTKDLTFYQLEAGLSFNITNTPDFARRLPNPSTAPATWE